jgi:phage terminase large subunit GpA-like protein
MNLTPDIAPAGAADGLWLSVSQIAERKGVTKQTISEKIAKMVAAGTLSPRPGKGKAKLVNLAEYDRLLGETTDLAREQGAQTKRAGAVSDGVPRDPTYTARQAERAGYEAELKRLDLEERLGQVRKVEDIEAAAVKCGEAVVRILEETRRRYCTAAAACAFGLGCAALCRSRRRVQRPVDRSVEDAAPGRAARRDGPGRYRQRNRGDEVRAKAFTTLLQISIGHSIDRDPCDMMVVQPTDSALTDFNSQKLGRAIEGTADPQEQGAAAGRPIRYRLDDVRKEVRRRRAFPLPGDVDSGSALEDDQESLLRRDRRISGRSERAGRPARHDQGAADFSFCAPAPGSAPISRRRRSRAPRRSRSKFEAGDQRRWTMTCPHCGDRGLRFEEASENFVYNLEPPYNAHYVAPCCGGVIEGWQKFDVYMTGRWEPTQAGAYKSYIFGGLTTPFVPFDHVAKKLVEAGNDPAKLKTVYNLTLGLPYEMKGDAPDHEVLLRRRELDLVRGYVPPRGLLLTGFVDVQMRGAWVEIVAHAPNREQWVVDAFYVDGDTSQHTNDVFETIRRQTVDREFPDAFGRTRKLDALAVDSGYRAHVVYAWVRLAQRMHPISGRDVILATKGLQRWGRPAIGQPTLVDVDMDGRKIKQGCKVWGIGTWPLKASHYSALRVERTADQVVFPAGYRHHGAWMDEVYFRQLTAEHLVEIKVHGKVTGRKWDKTGPNHFLDCAVGNLALAEYLGISSTTAEEWAALAIARGLPDELSTVDLFTVRAGAGVVDVAKADEAIAARKQADKAAPRPLDDEARNWLDGYEVNL